MKIESLKDLQKLMRMCEKNNIAHLKIGDLELRFWMKPETHKISTKSSESILNTEVFPEELVQVPEYNPLVTSEQDKIETEELTEEQLMFYSAVPEAGEQ